MRFNEMVCKAEEKDRGGVEETMSNVRVLCVCVCVCVCVYV
jgi:hypothetical protein